MTTGADDKKTETLHHNFAAGASQLRIASRLLGLLSLPHYILPNPWCRPTT